MRLVIQMSVQVLHTCVVELAHRLIKINPWYMLGLFTGAIYNNTLVLTEYTDGRVILFFFRLLEPGRLVWGHHFLQNSGHRLLGTFKACLRGLWQETADLKAHRRELSSLFFTFTTAFLVFTAAGSGTQEPPLRYQMYPAMSSLRI